MEMTQNMGVGWCELKGGFSRSSFIKLGFSSWLVDHDDKP